MIFRSYVSYYQRVASLAPRVKVEIQAKEASVVRRHADMPGISSGGHIHHTMFNVFKHGNNSENYCQLRSIESIR